MTFRTRSGGRRLVIAGAALFTVSTLFPIVASLLPEDHVSRGVGVLDVALAAALLVCAALTHHRAGPVRSVQVQAAAGSFHGAAWNVPLLLLIVFFVAGDRVRWNVLLPGLAWRAWLLAATVPAGVSLWIGDQ
jgi:Na+/melibiose symporter-like transporter